MNSLNLGGIDEKLGDKSPWGMTKSVYFLYLSCIQFLHLENPFSSNLNTMNLKISSNHVV